jgi:hypothetical protein
MLVVAAVLVALLYVPFVPQVSLDLRTTTATNTRSSLVATEMYEAWFTATVLWTTVTMQVGGRTATIPMPYTVVASDVVKTYTSHTTAVWTEVTTVTHSSSRTGYEALAGTHPLLSFLLILLFVMIPIVLYLRERKMLGESMV